MLPETATDIHKQTQKTTKRNENFKLVEVLFNNNSQLIFSKKKTENKNNIFITQKRNFQK